MTSLRPIPITPRPAGLRGLLRARRAFGARAWMLIALACLLACPATVARAGAWVPEPGSGYLKLWSKWLPGFGYHDGQGNTIDYGRYDELFLATYGELGVVPSLALTWQLDLVRAAWLEDPRDGQREGHATVGDPRVGARLKILQAGPLALAAELSVLPPLADDGALQTFVYADGTPAGQLRLGAGVWELGAGASAGLGFGAFYLQVGGGYLLRTDGFDDVLQFQLEGGANLSTDFAGRLRITGNLPLAADDAPYVENPAGVGNGVSYVGFALEADYQLDDGWYLGVALEGGMLEIRRQTGGPVISIYFAHAF